MDFLEFIINKQGRARKFSFNSRLKEGEVQIQRFDDGSLLIGFHKNHRCSPEGQRKIVRFPINKKQLARLIEIISK